MRWVTLYIGYITKQATLYGRTSAAAVVSAALLAAAAAVMTSWPQEDEASASMCSWISRTIRIRFSVCKRQTEVRI